MRLARRIKHKFGVSAAPVTVRRELAFHWRMVVWALLIGGGVSLAWSIFDSGVILGGFERKGIAVELRQLRERVGELEQENLKLRTEVAQSDRKMQIERVTQNDLAKSVKTLQDENAHLKEDIAFFRKLMSSDKSDGAVGIHRFQVTNGTLPGEYRYHLLLLQGGQRENEFRGKVQMLVNLTQGGKKMVMALPAASGKDVAAFNLAFKFYQRLEGTFQTVPGAQVKNVQVRVFENGAPQPKVMQTVNLS